MERLVTSSYSRLEYTTLLSVIENIKMGLIGFKNYTFLDNSIYKSADNCVDFLNKGLYHLKQNLNSNQQSIDLKEVDVERIEQIFGIEYSFKPLVVNIWQHVLTDVSRFDKDEPYSLLVHIIRDSDSIAYKESVLVNREIGCISTSLISNDYEHKHFYNGNSSLGLVFEINEQNFLGACEADGQVEQTTDNSNHNNTNNFQTLKRGNKHSINSIVFTGANNYQTTLTKTPFDLLEPKLINQKNIPFYNEVVLDKDYSYPKAVVMYSDDYVNISILEKAKYFSELYNIPILELDKSKRNIDKKAM